MTDSRPSFPADHKIVFRVPSGVPALGQIVVQFPNNPFTIDPSFSFNDVDVQVSPDSPYADFTDRPIAANPDVSNDGVSVDPSNGTITITLSSGGGIAANSYVRILLGDNATFGGNGSFQIENPSSTGSYLVNFGTYNSVATPIDYGSTIIVILPAVGVDVNQNRVNPAVLSNGMPTGTIPSNVNAVLVSLNTDVFSNCRYATTSGVSYDAMTNSFTRTSNGTFHTATIAPITQGTTYNLYVRCQDFVGNKNTDDYLISFTAGQPTGTGAGGGTSGGDNPSGGGGGAGEPFPAGPAQPSVVIKGIGVPNATITLLQDGKTVPPGTRADSTGKFTVTIDSLPQGTYSFTILESDASGHVISSYTTTITVISGTSNSLTNNIIPPSVTVATSTVKPGGTVDVSGFAPPSSTIELVVMSQENLQDPIKLTTSADATGAWSYSLSTADYPIDTYELKARATLPGYTASNYSGITYLGVGTAPKPKNRNGDLNGDGKVNLVDFSIMLFHWGQNYAPADLNGDGTVGLVDFSILLFNWTG
ncbi:MAG TPA: Ig-like domain-containing protein [Candidatus Paceibacterota bacterium]|nr:Ig-like domain-containing protein [Candidatus Paceibacterota bacterium]